MDRIILSQGYQRDGLSLAQIDKAANLFADAQAKAGVSAGKYTPLILQSGSKNFILEVQFDSDGATETVNIKHCAEISGRALQKQHRDTERFNVTEQEAKPKAKAAAKPKSKTAAKPKAKAAAKPKATGKAKK